MRKDEMEKLATYELEKLERELREIERLEALIKQQAIRNAQLSDAEKRYILSKSTTKTEVAPGLSSSVFLDLEESPQFPFEIYMQSQSLYFARSVLLIVAPEASVSLTLIQSTCCVFSAHPVITAPSCTTKPNPFSI